MNLAILVFEYPNIQICTYPAIKTSEYPDLQKSEYPDIQKSEYLNLGLGSEVCEGLQSIGIASDIHLEGFLGAPMSVHVQLFFMFWDLFNKFRCLDRPAASCNLSLFQMCKMLPPVTSVAHSRMLGVNGVILYDASLAL